jgi:hypothetical protein
MGKEKFVVVTSIREETPTFYRDDQDKATEFRDNVILLKPWKARVGMW